MDGSESAEHRRAVSTVSAMDPRTLSYYADHAREVAEKYESIRSPMAR